MSKLFFYDIESSGLRHWENGIHQISGAIEINGEVQEEFDFHVQPHPKAIIEDEALDIGGVTREQLATYPLQGAVYNQLIVLLEKYVDRYNKEDKFFLIGYNNAAFDNNFLRAFFVQNGDKYFGSWFWSSPIDVFILAAFDLQSSRHKMVDFKLHTVAKAYNIEVDEKKLHDGMYDIFLTREIYKKIFQESNIMAKDVFK